MNFEFFIKIYYFTIVRKHFIELYYYDNNLLGSVVKFLNINKTYSNVSLVNYTQGVNIYIFYV